MNSISQLLLGGRNEAMRNAGKKIPEESLYD